MVLQPQLLAGLSFDTVIEVLLRGKHRDVDSASPVRCRRDFLLPEASAGVLSVDACLDEYQAQVDQGRKEQALLAERPSVAAELGPLNCLKRRDLELLRRRYAQRNHPDRFPPEHRQVAALRMQIANSLIDSALDACG